MRASMKQVLTALKCQQAPHQIWQRAFDYDPQHLYTLVKYTPYVPGSGIMPSASCLIDYSLDLKYEEIQPDLFRCLFPLCLEAWRQHLFTSTRASQYSAFVEYFLDTLSARPFLQDLLDEQEYETIVAFMQDSILDRLDQEPGILFSRESADVSVWFGELSAFAVIFPFLERLWNEWWSMKTPGHAMAVLQYISCLLYLKDENPIFAPWTPPDGGGPPKLWERRVLGNEKGWQEENVSFIQSTLTVNYVENKLKQAAAIVRNQENPILPDQMLQDLETYRDILAYHLDILPLLLVSSHLTSSEKSVMWE